MQLDKQFWWNEFIQTDLIEKGCADWVLPVIQGFAFVERCEIRGEKFELALISRRSKLRAGLRYKRRGLDSEGNCANFVETEQIMYYIESVISYVQIRGSSNAALLISPSFFPPSFSFTSLSHIVFSSLVLESN